MAPRRPAPRGREADGRGLASRGLLRGAAPGPVPPARDGRYGSPERAKREIFARYASFIYLGHGRYGFAAGSEYYFGKPLSSYGPEDAGKAALRAAIMKSPRDYAPVPGDPRPQRRRNQILALMARNGHIPQDLATRGQAEPIRVAARSPVKTHAPAAIEHVFDELKRYGGEDLVQGWISVRSTVDERVQTIANATRNPCAVPARSAGSRRA